MYRLQPIVLWNVGSVWPDLADFQDEAEVEPFM